MIIKKTYIYANGEIPAQHNGNHEEDRYFYMHDRLGSVRQVIDQNGVVKNHYTYDPWGLPISGETSETISNLYRFAGYVYDSEISMYPCFKRIYDPVLGRFTSRDPVQGNYEEPMTLHRYLYCLNNPINETDPTGEQSNALGWGLVGDLVEGINAYNEALAAGIDNAGGDWWGIMGVAIFANSFREAYFEQKNIAERAFGAAECVGQVKANFMISLMDCFTSGVRDEMIAAAGCIAGCAFAGPAMPVCLETCGNVTGIGTSVADMGCIIAAAGNYSQNIGNCLNK